MPQPERTEPRRGEHKQNEAVFLAGCLCQKNPSVSEEA